MYIFNEVLSNRDGAEDVRDGIVVIVADSLEGARLHFVQCFPNLTAQFDEAESRGSYAVLQLADGEGCGVIAHTRLR